MKCMARWPNSASIDRYMTAPAATPTLHQHVPKTSNPYYAFGRPSA